MPDVFDQLVETPVGDVFDQAAGDIFDQAAADAPVSTARGLGASLQRGLKNLAGLPEVVLAAGTEGMGEPRIMDRRRAFEAAMRDPEYMERLAKTDSQEQARKIERVLGPQARLDAAMTPRRALQEAIAEDVARAQGESAALPKSEAQERMAGAGTTSEKWAAWRKDPFELTASIVLESLPASLAGALVGGAAGSVAAGVGSSSLLMTFSSEFLNNAAELGYDVRDPDALQEFLNTPEDFEAAFRPAAVKASLVGGVDAATAGAAGRFIEPALKQGRKQIAIASSKELGMQAAGGSGGELLGSLAAGQKPDLFDVAMEGLAEIATGPAEAAGNIRQAQRISQGNERQGNEAETKPPAVTPGADRAPVIERAIEELTGRAPAAQPIADLTAAVRDLQATLTGNQIKPQAPSPKPQTPNPKPRAVEDELLEQALADLPADARAEIERRLEAETSNIQHPTSNIEPETLTATPARETTDLAAPETQTGGTATELATPAGSTPTQTGVPPESGTIPVEGGETPSRSAARSRTRTDYTNQRPHDLIDELEGQIGGKISWKLIKEANPHWKPTGAARKIFAAEGEPADTAAQAMFESGLYKGDPGQVDQFGDAVNAAASARKGFRQRAARENQLLRQADAFARDSARPGPKQQPVISDDLQPGDALKIRGTPFTVRELEFDEDGRVIGVTLDDGAKYGTQEVAGGTELQVDHGTLEKNRAPTVTRQTEEDTTKVRVSQNEPAPQARHSLAEEGFAFDAPESVADQKARQAREAKERTQAEQAKERAAYVKRGGDRLTGADVDTTAEMFGGPEGQGTRQDKSGQGSLFEQGTGYAVDRESVVAVSYGYGVPPETTAQVLEKGQTHAYQTTFDDLPSARSEAGSAGRPRSADSLTTLGAADFTADFAGTSQVSSIDQSKAPPTVPTYNVNGTVIRTAADFVKTLLALRSPNNECLKVVILEKFTGKVVHSEVMYAGTLDTISADTRDFMRLYEKHGQAGTVMMISHNHPSGDPTPSEADRKFTSKLQLAAQTAGFEVFDHIITNGQRYYSLRTDQMESVDKPQLAPWEIVGRDQLRRMEDSMSFERLIKNLRQSNRNVSHIIYLTTRGKVTAIERVTPSANPIRLALLRGIGREAAAQVLIDYGPNVSRSDAYEWTLLINRNLPGTTSRIIDFAADGLMSGRMEGLVTSNILGEDRAGQFREAAGDLQGQIRDAENELRAAIRQHMQPPAGMTKADALAAKTAAAAKLRRLVAEQLEMMTGTNVNTARSPEETSEMISQTVDLLNSIEDEISDLKARSQAVPSDLNKLRKDLQTRLNILKGWSDDQTDQQAAGGGRRERPAPVAPENRVRQMTFEAATDPDRATFSEFWDALKRGLRYLTSPIPELPLTGELARKSALFRRGFRLFTAEGNRVREEAAAKVKAVLEPLEKLRSRSQNDALKRYYRLGTALDRARQAQDDTRISELARRLKQMEDAGVNADPFNLFRKLVLYRDLWWRGTYLKTEDGKPLTLPNGMSLDEVAAELRSLTAQQAAHPDRAAIAESLKRHYALTDELQKSILAHGEIIPEALRNPLYFPHHILEHWTGRIDKVRPSTEEDFRKYLIAPVGSGKLLQADYLKAMYVHTADVLSHNARVDLVQKYWQAYDISARLKEEHGEAWDKPWNLPPGYKLYAPFKKLPLRMDYILSREVLADQLGVLFNDGDLRARLGEAGAVLKISPEDLHAALVAGEKIKWALPVEIADALDGIAKREAARSNPGFGHILGAPARGLNTFWKRVKLFAPWNWIRYEYGNLTTDVVDKVLVADPRVATYLKQAAREVLTASHKGTKSDAFKAASREGVFDTITASEAGELQRLREFSEFATTLENARNMVHNFLAATTKASHFREATFRYAKFLADVDRMQRGELPVYAGAYHEDIEALGDTVEGQQQMLQGDELTYAKAAEISLKTFGDYNSLGVFSQWLRTYAIPFFSWQDVNFRYHANQLRNIADGIKGIRGGTARDVALKYAAVRVVTTLTAVAIAQQLWNTFGGPLLGLWDDDDDLENQLSAADRRRSHILLGKDKNGQVLVAYTPSAFADVAEWVGGLNAKRLFMEYAQGQITLDQFISDYAKQVPADTLNKIAQSVGPLGKAPYEAISGKAVFPDVLDQRTIPKADRWWRLAGTMTDDRAVNWLRQVFDKDYYSQPANEQLQQIILQVRRRDPEQWAYYEAREAASDWKEAKTGKRFEAGSYDAPEAQVLRNFRRAIYRADVAAAEQFYRRLLEYGYTAERLDASIRAQAPLADLNKDQRKEYVQTLDARGQRDLALAERYYSRIGALDKRERSLFPTERRVKYGSPFPANTNRLREIMENRASSAAATPPAR
jgi:proteasome lid subunit RPN8/RPN11